MSSCMFLQQLKSCVLIRTEYTLWHATNPTDRYGEIASWGSMEAVSKGCWLSDSLRILIPSLLATRNSSNVIGYMNRGMDSGNSDVGSS